MKVCFLAWACLLSAQVIGGAAPVPLHRKEYMPLVCLVKKWRGY